MKLESIRAMVMGIDPVNVDYILERADIMDDFHRAYRYASEGNVKMAAWLLKRVKIDVAKFRERYLTPANIRVGDGVTVNLWSDRHAATVIKVTKSTVTVRRDKATLNPDFKPEWIPGGFAGHCTNQDEQTYTYEPDEKGTQYTFRWSRKYQRYGQPGDLTLSKGRHEFYDYNF